MLIILPFVILLHMFCPSEFFILPLDVTGRLCFENFYSWTPFLLFDYFISFACSSTVPQQDIMAFPINFMNIFVNACSAFLLLMQFQIKSRGAIHFVNPYLLGNHHKITE